MLAFFCLTFNFSVFVPDIQIPDKLYQFWWVHIIGMASLTHTPLFLPMTITPAGRGRQRKEESQIKCSLSLSFRLNPWRFSQPLTHLQVCNVQLGSEEVADGPLASHSKGKTHLYFSCVPSTPPFHHPVQVAQFKGDPIISLSVLSVLFKCLWQAAKYSYNDILSRNMQSLSSKMISALWWDERTHTVQNVNAQH